MAILLSVLALSATFYQLYLQRVHNKKSLKPMGQIVLEDRKQAIAIYLCNNGLGPLLIDRITFVKAGEVYSRLEECLDLDARSYIRASTHDAVQRVVLPNSSLTIFEDQLKGHESEAELNHIRHQLSPITLKVEFRDIYDTQMTTERDFQWFSRHTLKLDKTVNEP